MGERKMTVKRLRLVGYLTGIVTPDYMENSSYDPSGRSSMERRDRKEREDTEYSSSKSLRR